MTLGETKLGEREKDWGDALLCLLVIYCFLQVLGVFNESQAWAEQGEWGGLGKHGEAAGMWACKRLARVRHGATVSV